jgi:hypothetical protein
MLLHNIHSDETAENPSVRRRSLRKISRRREKFDSMHHRARNDMNVHETPTIDDWLHLIQAEYREMPGLTLTKPQVRRLWQLEPKMCDEVLDALVSSDFLKHTPEDLYVLSTSRRH